MISRELRELINRGIDGDLSEVEQRRLARELGRSATARTVHAELKALQTALASLPEVDPPVHLRQRIRAAVHAEVPTSELQRSWGESLLALLHPPTLLRFGTIFAGGLVAGAFLFMLLVNPFVPSGVSNDSASGSLLSKAESYTVNVDGASGQVVATPTPTGKELAITLSCRTATTLKLSFDPSRVQLENVSDLQSPLGPVLLNSGIVQLSGTGMQRCTLSFAGAKDSHVNLLVTGAGGGTFQAEIPVR